MNYSDGKSQLATLQQRMAQMRKEMQALRAAIEPQPVEDYVFKNGEGEIRLSNLFSGKEDLFMVHNMGSSCPYCTLWADGYNGVYHHLANRAAFIVSSPEAPEQQRKFAMGRGWKFPMVSHHGTSFAADMGYRSARGGWQPGVSVFQRKDGKILRVADSSFGPGDDFCSLWHFFDLLPQGAGDWQPQFAYL